MGVSFTGLSSGFDSQGLIDKLYAAERAPEAGITQRKNETQARISILGDLISKVQSLQGAAVALNLPSAINTYAVTTSSTAQLTAAGTSGAVPGTYSLSVGQLAQAQTSKSSAFASNTAGIAGTGSLQITVGAKAPVSVSYGAGDTLDDIASRINGAGARVTATVLFDGTNYQLMMSGKDSGAASAMTFTEGGNALGFAAPGSTLVAAQDAKVTMNGVLVTRPTNAITDMIPGVNLALSAVTPPAGAATVVTVQSDLAGVQKKAQSVVDAYNAVHGLVHNQLTYSGVHKGNDTFFGDSTLRSLEGALSTILTSPYSDGTTSTDAGSLGLKLDKTGTLTIDAAKFTAAMTADPQAFQRFMIGGGNNGFAAAANAFATSYTSSTTGILSSKRAGLTSVSTALDKQVASIETAATDYRNRLQKQFTQLDLTLSTLNQQQTYLASLFGTGATGGGLSGSGH